MIQNNVNDELVRLVTLPHSQQNVRPTVSSLEDFQFEAVSYVAAIPELTALAGKRIGVVGSTGLIGGTILDVLIHANRTTLGDMPAEIYGIGRSKSAETGDHIYVQLQPTDPLPECLRNLDFVVYAAGTASDYANRVHETIESQTLSLLRFLDGLNDSSRIVYVSSTRVYGSTKSDQPLTEDALAEVPPMHCRNVYDSAKRLGESVCLQYMIEERCQPIVVRASNIYGFRETRSHNALIGLVNQALAEGRINLTGNPHTIRNLCCSFDLVQGLLKSLVKGRPGEAYNMGSRENYTIEEVVRQIADACPQPVTISHQERFPIVDHQNISIRKAEQELGYKPRYKLTEVLPYFFNSHDCHSATVR